MNDLIPIGKNEVSLSEEEMSLSIFQSSNNQILFFIIPIALFFFLRQRTTSPLLQLTSPNYKENIPLKSTSSIINPLDPAIIDKMTLLLEGVKKASTLNDLRKNMASSGKLNMDNVKELVNVFGSTMGEGSKVPLQNITNMLSMAEKFKDIKKVMAIQKAIKPDGNGDFGEQINHMIEAIAPLLPEEQGKNIENFKKMAQMMNLTSLFEENKDADGEESIE